MTTAKVELEAPRPNIENLLEPRVPELRQGVHAAQARADWAVILHPKQRLTISPRTHMTRLVIALNVDADVPRAPDPMRDQEARWALDSIRDERAGTLARFVGYLEKNGVVGGRPKTFEEHHAMQKYAYLASEFGGPFHYEFDFLENGAYSSVLALDLYAKARERAGAASFEKSLDRGRAFVQMIQGRGMRTLQAMTFAVRDIRLGVGRDEFVGTMLRERSLYSKRVLEWAFDRVSENIGFLRKR